MAMLKIWLTFQKEKQKISQIYTRKTKISQVFCQQNLSGEKKTVMAGVKYRGLLKKHTQWIKDFTRKSCQF
jgi:hypothetical protein